MTQFFSRQSDNGDARRAGEEFATSGLSRSAREKQLSSAWRREARLTGALAVLVAVLGLLTGQLLLALLVLTVALLARNLYATYRTSRWFLADPRDFPPPSTALWTPVLDRELERNLEQDDRLTRCAPRFATPSKPCKQHRTPWLRFASTVRLSG